jgi:DNA sulfur modification protein DndB
MTASANSRLFLPALRGQMGDWEYFSCLVPIQEVANRVKFAEELQAKTSKLSELLQRSLNEGRGQEIANYLATEKERLFSSLVVAVYGGDPEWHEFGDLKSERPDISVEDVPLRSRHSVGFLSFNGEERLFALDGQHRLAGIKLHSASANCKESDDISVLFVAHRRNYVGIKRTRRLFTTLNKRAKAVSKGEIISLDEDDAMAICARRLVEECEYFKGKRIAYTAHNNIPNGNRECLTTIGNLYDVLKILFVSVNSEYKAKAQDLLYYRPDDKKLEDLFGFAVQFFTEMSKNFKPLQQFFDATRFERVTAKYRGEFGGNLLFRPIGLTVITRVIAELTKTYDWTSAIRLAAKLPLQLDSKPLVDLMWDKSRAAMKKPQNDALARRIFLYMLGEKKGISKLAKDYVTAIGAAENPDRFNDDVKVITQR